MMSLASTAFANSGSFCNPQGERVDFVCNETPSGPGWVPQADGCFHRASGARCGDNGGGRPTPPPRPNPPRPAPPAPYPGPGRGGDLVCSARDAGWEEHGSHNSCRECLREHGRCVETCAVVEDRCEAQGVDRRGNLVSFIGTGRGRYDAQDQAMRNCSYNASRCQIVRCDTAESNVTRRDCR